MIELTVGQLVVWLAGSAWLALLWPKPMPGRAAVVAGYGYLAGALGLTLLMRLLSLIGMTFSWASIGAPMLGAAIIALFAFKRRGFTLALPRFESSAAGLRSESSSIENDVIPSGLRRAFWWLFVAMIAMHLVLAGLEIVWRPLFPWDAWTQWATKARVWYEAQRMVPFSDIAHWWSGGTYMDAAPGYPANLPLMQVWASIALGRWDDSLMNLPFVLVALSLALGFYGQLRIAGHGAVFAIAGTYAVLSLPMLDTHVALAGYADLPLAAYFGLSAIALWQWSVSRDRAQLALAAILAVACPMTKNPGWIWLFTLAPAVAVTLWPKRGLQIVLGLGVAVLAVPAVLIGLGQAEIPILGYRLGSKFTPVWEPLWQNYYQFANWHLLWYVLPVVMLLNRRRLFVQPMIAGTLIVLAGLAFLFIVFSFTNASNWVADYSTVNRATLHLAPFLVFYVLRLVHTAISERGPVHPIRAPEPASLQQETAPTTTA